VICKRSDDRQKRIHENDNFDVGASSNPAKFSKSLKNIENYIQKTYKDPDDIVKTIQKMKKVSLS